MQEVVYWFFSTVLVGIVGVSVLKHTVEKMLTNAEKKQDQKKAAEIERNIIYGELQAQQVSVLKWIVKGLQRWDTEHTYFNGELNSSYQELLQAERAVDIFEREQAAKHRAE